MCIRDRFINLAPPIAALHHGKTAGSGERSGRRGDLRDASAQILLQRFSAEGHCEHLLHGQGCLLFDFVRPAFPLPTTASPSLQGPEGRFGEAVVACDLPKPCTYPSSERKPKSSPARTDAGGCRAVGMPCRKVSVLVFWTDCVDVTLVQVYVSMRF